MTARERSRKHYRTRLARTPVVLQMEAVECGAACLAIVLAYHGRIVPLAELRVECGVTRDGSNAFNVVRAAERYGLAAAGYSRDIEGLLEFAPPYIVFWSFNHFVVVEGFRGGVVHINDPASGHRTVTLEEFDRAFTGVVLVFKPTERFQRGGRAPSVVHALRTRARGLAGPLTYAVLAAFLLVLPGLAIPAFSQVFIDEILVRGRTEWIRPLLALMVATAVAVGVLRTLQFRALRRMRLALSARLSSQFFWHLLHLPVSFYAQRYAGEISSRSRLNNRLAGVLSGQLAQTVIDVVMMGFYAAVMAMYDRTLTLVAVASALLNFVALRWLSRRRTETNMRLLQEDGKVAGASIAALQGMETIKASGLEAGFFRRWAGHYTQAANARQEMELANQVLGVLPVLLGASTNLLVLVLGGSYVISGELTIGALIAFQLLAASFLRPVGNLVHLGQVVQDLRGDLLRVEDVLSHGVDPDLAARDGARAQTQAAAPAETSRLQGELELRQLTFGYDRNAPPLIEGLDLLLRPGRRVALVGGSGSGKSTLARLVCGLYLPWSGEVLLDGRPRQEVPRALRANGVAMVDQDVLLFGGSVRQNLTLWDESIPERALLRACQDAGILERVRALPGGFDSELDEGGGNLSGGERQRLEIARALVLEPALLVLDEATSALDTESERRIVEQIALRGCSCLIVAHRLSTIRDCDEILVLERGQVIERGTHEELWSSGGLYRELLASDEIPDAEAAA
jgi:ATP-binding cassette subfamily C protein